MTILTPMRTEIFASYLALSIVNYAEENVASGCWPSESALARSQADYERLLPQGIVTPDNYLFEIMESEHGNAVGYLWLSAQEKFGNRSGFVYDLKINEEHRRKGHAQRAFLALESIALELGISSIDLHVFAHNINAKTLYDQLGYRVTGVNMSKKIGAIDT